MGVLEKGREKLKAQKLRNCESLLDAVIDIRGFCLSRLPAPMTLKNTVVNAIVSCRGGPTRTERVKIELRWVNPNVFQVPSASIPNAAVADRLNWGE